MNRLECSLLSSSTIQWPRPCPAGRAVRSGAFGFPLAARGFSLVEAIAVVAITAVLASMAFPFMATVRARRAIEGAASELAADLRYARSESVSRNASVTVRFEADPEGSCYVIHTGSSAGCHCLTLTGVNAPSTCEAGSADIRTVRFPAAAPLRVAANVADISFSPLNGVASPGGTITIAANETGGAPLHAVIRHVVSPAGRVRSCAVGSASFGLRPC